MQDTIKYSESRSMCKYRKFSHASKIKRNKKSKSLMEKDIKREINAGLKEYAMWDLFHSC